MISAMDRLPPGCPEPALANMRIMLWRILLAVNANPLIDRPFFVAIAIFSIDSLNLPFKNCDSLSLSIKIVRYAPNEKEKPPLPTRARGNRLFVKLEKGGTLGKYWTRQYRGTVLSTPFHINKQH
jgi:hypothetical protein